MFSNHNFNALSVIFLKKIYVHFKHVSCLHKLIILLLSRKKKYTNYTVPTLITNTVFSIIHNCCLKHIKIQLCTFKHSRHSKRPHHREPPRSFSTPLKCLLQTAEAHGPDNLAVHQGCKFDFVFLQGSDYSLPVIAVPTL